VSTAEHIAPDSALFLVALDDDDPEKRAALDHVRSCEACRRLLTESERLLGVLDREEAAPLSLPPGLEQRVHAAVFGKPRRLRWEYVAWLLGGLTSLGLLLHDSHPRPELYADIGLRCLRYELGLGTAAFVAGWFSVRLRKQTPDPLRASVFAMSGALVGQMLLRTRCEAADGALHLLAFHVSGVLLAALLSAGATRLLAR
jgi:hypothetical protein